MTGELPKSMALAEASPDSLTELMSRDPEAWTLMDEDRLVEAMRNMRARWAQSDASKPAKAPKAVADKAKSLISGQTLEDMGL